MPIKFECACGHRIGAPESFAGKRAKCPGCGAVVVIPAASSPPPPSRPPSKTPTNYNIKVVEDPGQPTHIRFHCENCGRRIGVPVSFAGKTGRCPGCDETVEVPLTSPIVPPAKAPSRTPTNYGLKPVEAVPAATATASGAGKPRRLSRKALVAAGSIGIALLIVASVVLLRRAPKLDAGRQAAMARDCTNNLRQLGTYIVMYCSKYGRDRDYPGPGIRLFTDLFNLPTPESAIGAGNESLLICKSSGETLDKELVRRNDPACCSYECVEFKVSDGVTQPDEPIAWDKRPCHDGKRNVLYFSGSVWSLSEADFQALRGKWAAVTRNRQPVGASPAFATPPTGGTPAAVAQVREAGEVFRAALVIGADAYDGASQRLTNILFGAFGSADYRAAAAQLDAEATSIASDEDRAVFYYIAARASKFAGRDELAMEFIAKAIALKAEPDYIEFKSQLSVGDAGGNTSKPNGPKVGEDVSFSDSTWAVTEAIEMGQTLKSNNQFQEDAQTRGRFILVHFGVRNDSKGEDRILLQPKLIDSRGRQYNTLDSQDFYIPEGGKTISIEQLTPGVIKDFWAAYEVAGDAGGLQFKARSLASEDEFKLVSLEICDNCHGHGELRCDVCNGYGNIAVWCPTCGGTGQVCFKHGKRGFCETCQFPDGSERCPKCGGAAGRDCVSLQCANCGGKGKYPCTVCSTGPYESWGNPGIPLLMEAERLVANAGRDRPGCEKAIEKLTRVAKDNPDTHAASIAREWIAALQDPFATRWGQQSGTHNQPPSSPQSSANDEGEAESPPNSPKADGEKAPTPCPACGGRGQWRCQDCTNGQVTIDCDRCHRNTIIDCSKCNGSGEVACQCGGHDYKCPDCQGAGQVRCKDCGGRGNKPCPKCKGKGEISSPCPHCRKGIVTCTACDGTGHTLTEEEKAERAAASALVSAKAFETAKAADKAIEKYKELIAKYPNTKAAKEAEERMKALEAGK